MDINEALEAALAEVKAAIPQAQAEAERTARHVAELLEEERGLQLALARRGPSAGATATVGTEGVDAVPVEPPPEPAVPEVAEAEPHGDWAPLNHMDAVLRALVEARRPLSPKEIVRALRAVGRSDSGDQVRAALNALKRQRRASLTGRAQWVATAEVGLAADQKAFEVGLAADQKALAVAANLSRPDQAQLHQSPSNGPASIPMDEEEVMR
jgi:hypothetical protein